MCDSEWSRLLLTHLMTVGRRLPMTAHTLNVRKHVTAVKYLAGRKKFLSTGWMSNRKVKRTRMKAFIQAWHDRGSHNLFFWALHYDTDDYLIVTVVMLCFPARFMKSNLVSALHERHLCVMQSASRLRLIMLQTPWKWIILAEYLRINDLMERKLNWASVCCAFVSLYALLALARSDYCKSLILLDLSTDSGLITDCLAATKQQLVCYTDTVQLNDW